MPRAPKCRRVSREPVAAGFKPQGVPGRALEVVLLRHDELEAVRLADFEGLYQDAAAERMEISRPTFARLVAGARQKIADALLHGKLLHFESGAYTMAIERTFNCVACGHTWAEPHGTGRPTACPKCGAPNIHRANDAPGAGGRRGRHHGRSGGQSGSRVRGRGVGGRRRRHLAHNTSDEERMP